jgi:hypothetical protein
MSVPYIFAPRTGTIPLLELDNNFTSLSNDIAALQTSVSNNFPTKTGVGASGSWSINAATATKATDVAGGAAGQVLYQVGVNDTAFTGTGTTGQFLMSNGAAAPTWATVDMSAKLNLTGGTLTGNLDLSAGNVTVAAGSVNVNTGNITVAVGSVTSAKFKTTTWEISEVGGALFFKSNGVNKAKLESNGTLTVTGDIVAYGTV